MKTFIVKILILILPYAFIIAGTNYYFDPANILTNGKYEAEVAKLLLKGHNLDRLKNFDERLALKNIISNLPYTPDIVTIGTSRSLEISSDFFPNKKFNNCSLSHANIKDLIAVVGLLDSCNKLPKQIYLETSSVIVNSSSLDEWESIHEYYDYWLQKNFIENSNDNFKLHLFKKKITALFSFAYFRNSLLSIKSGGGKKVVDVGSEVPKGFGRFFDYSISYSDAYRKVDTLKAIADAEIFTTKNATPKINTTDLQLLMKMIEYLKSKKVTVILLNIPFQPDCYNILNKRNKLFIDLSKDIELFAMKNNVKLVGTFNPYEANIRRSQFYDQLHCDKAALKNVIKIEKYIPN